MTWSIETYCQTMATPLDPSVLPPSTNEFIAALNLSQVHPHCLPDAPRPYELPGVPVMGPMHGRFTETHNNNPFQIALTLWFMVAPALLAMSELWLRLFAALLAPVCLAYLLWLEQVRYSSELQNKSDEISKSDPKRTWIASLACWIGVASSLVLMTDTLYVLEFGPTYGCTLFVVSLATATWTCLTHHLPRTSIGLACLAILAATLIWDAPTQSISFGDIDDHTEIGEGLYYDSSNPTVSGLVNAWPSKYRTYDASTGQTPWMPTGDSRTGLPFLLNKLEAPHFDRFFLPADDGVEVLAIDISFPPDGHNFTKPLFLIFHGLNGGSDEEYLRDFTHRAIADGSTVAVMIARGLMDLPIRGWNIFHGAITMDAHAAARQLRRTLGGHQRLVGIGYSMGAIVINNYVTTYGPDVALDAALSISGGLELREQEHFSRAQRLWQPMLAEEARDTFMLGKWGERMKQKLSHEDLMIVFRASHITELDRHAVVPYHGFDDLDHYYRSMSALGDIPLDAPANYANGKIHNVSIPLCILHSLDDPLITWRTVASNHGFRRPENLVRTGHGNLLILLTKAGGHVGWPTGVLPFLEKWRWMSEAALSFAHAVSQATNTGSS